MVIRGLVVPVEQTQYARNSNIGVLKEKKILKVGPGKINYIVD